MQMAPRGCLGLGFSADLETAVAWDNHKRTVVDEAHLCTSMAKEVQHCWQLPLLVDTVWQMPSSTILLMGVVHQVSIDEHGHPISKD